jgi:phenylacetate-CoA ligase
MFSDTVAELERLRDDIKDKIKSVVGINAKIQLVAPKSIPAQKEKPKELLTKE